MPPHHYPIILNSFYDHRPTCKSDHYFLLQVVVSGSRTDLSSSPLNGNTPNRTLTRRRGFNNPEERMLVLVLIAIVIMFVICTTPAVILSLLYINKSLVESVGFSYFRACANNLVNIDNQHFSDGPRSKLFDPDRAILWCLDRVSHLWVSKFPPQNPKLFIFLPLGQKKYHQFGSKKYLGQPLIYCGSEICLGWAKSGPISTTFLSFYDQQIIQIFI